MGRPQHADGQRTRQAILDATLRLFADKGFFGTSLRDIGTAVGIRESALYNYFPSKEALFDALIAAEQEFRAASASTVLAESIRDPRVMLTRLATMTLEHFSTPRQQQFFCILMSDGIRLAKEGRINLFERMSSSQTRLKELMRRLVKEGWLRDEDPQLLVMEFMGPLIMWRHLRAIDAADARRAVIQDPRVFARRHVNQFLRGAGAPTRETQTRVGRSAGRRPARRAAALVERSL
jgi:AcrR family transcriptional regulator